jgi:hypothetical protein
MAAEDITQFVAGHAAVKATTPAPGNEQGSATSPPLSPRPLPPEPAPALADPRQARAYQAAALMLRNGRDLAQVKSMMVAEGFSEWEPDPRSDHEKTVDRNYGIPEHIDPAIYNFAIPLGVVTDMAGAAKLSADLRDLVSGLAFDPSRGSAFARTIALEIKSGNEATARDGVPMHPAEAADILNERIKANDARIAQIFPDPVKLAEARKVVADLVDGLKLSNTKAATALKPGGVCCSPEIFMALHARSRFIAAWHAARTAK